MLFRHVCKMDPARRLALRFSRYQRDASLPTLGRQKLVETEGLAPPQSVRTARLQRAAITALPRLEIWGSGGIRTRTDTAYETVALLLCYRAKVVGRLGEAKRSGQPAGWGQGPEREARVKCSEFCRLRAGCFTVKAYDPWKWWSLRVSHPPEFLPARKTTTLRSPRTQMAAAGGFAPPFTGSKPAVLLVRCVVTTGCPHDLEESECGWMNNKPTAKPHGQHAR
jgi:hypothetical protein